MTILVKRHWFYIFFIIGRNKNIYCKKKNKIFLKLVTKILTWCKTNDQENLKKLLQKLVPRL